MANICSNYLKITGEDEQLDALQKRIEDQDPALIAIVPNFEQREHADYCIYNCEFDGDDLMISFGSRWSSPVEEIISLSKEYPELEYNLWYEEGAMEYYGEASIKDGECSRTKLNAKEYHEKYHEEYQEELEELNRCSDEEFLNNYTHDNFFEEHPYCYLDLNVVNRIKDKDLPKFINRQWFDVEAEKEYKRRLAGGSS